MRQRINDILLEYIAFRQKFSRDKRLWITLLVAGEELRLLLKLYFPSVINNRSISYHSIILYDEKSKMYAIIVQNSSYAQSSLTVEYVHLRMSENSNHDVLYYTESTTEIRDNAYRIPKFEINKLQRSKEREWYKLKHSFRAVLDISWTLNTMICIIELGLEETKGGRRGEWIRRQKRRKERKEGRMEGEKRWKGKRELPSAEKDEEKRKTISIEERKEE